MATIRGAKVIEKRCYVRNRRKNSKKKKDIVHFRTMPKYDFMKYYRVVRYWAKRKYELTEAELEMLFFLYSEGLFTISKLQSYEEVMSWNKERFHHLQREGFIHVWRKRGIGEVNLYELTYKAKKMVAAIYKMLSGEEPMPTSPRRNPIMNNTKKTTFTDKMYQKQILQMNDEIKERLQHLSQESSDMSDHQ